MRHTSRNLCFQVADASNKHQTSHQETGDRFLLAIMSFIICAKLRGSTQLLEDPV